ncbi:MAG: UDP-2,3-diacylglucosamine diphosphatase [Proteobacteria bacterium]|jgi:UDP-2,3-diacylglucosamine pyrophosphatase LpxH|nr:UDP-2,3-diacylglucosamine diphosphatase [Alphaproteobacteria bacterium]NCC03219.1 UDP-2,3-diacylglucosamine diphosphatase [Pseudomonadota bacterium]
MSEQAKQVQMTYGSIDCLKFRTIWISDLHLGTAGCQAEAVLDFLMHTESEFLYLVGDIIDGWHLKKRWYWPQLHNDVIQKILRRARKGSKVFYIPGNHDEVARDFCGLSFGDVLVSNQEIHITANGKRYLVLHGDQFDAVMGYAKWLAKLGDVAYTFILALNTYLNKVRRYFGFSYWSLSAYLKYKVKNAVEYISSYEEFIAREARRYQVDGVICGHIHHAEMRVIGASEYYNDGDWVESCTALVEDFEGNLSVICWPKQKTALLDNNHNEDPDHH